MSYNFITQYDSPNHGGFGTQIALPARRAVLHWWGSPSGQNPQGIIDWLCNPVSQVSAHAVVWPGNVACIVNYDQPSWANGNTVANTTAVTLECDPNDIDGTIPTIVDYLADLVRQGNLAADFELSGHRDWYNTACPGAYYDWLPTIRRRVTDALTRTSTTQQQQEEDMQLTDTITRPDGHRGTVGDVLAYLDMRMERLEAAILGRGLPVYADDGTDTGDKTDLATEAAWNRVNARRAAEAAGLSEDDIERLLQAMADSTVQVDVRVTDVTGGAK